MCHRDLVFVALVLVGKLGLREGFGGISGARRDLRCGFESGRETVWNVYLGFEVFQTHAWIWICLRTATCNDLLPSGSLNMHEMGFVQCFINIERSNMAYYDLNI